MEKLLAASKAVGRMKKREYEKGDLKIIE